jgi:hypothetical protein
VWVGMYWVKYWFINYQSSKSIANILDNRL